MKILKNGRSTTFCIIYIFLLLMAVMWPGVSAKDNLGHNKNDLDSLSYTLKKWELTFYESPSLVSDSVAQGNLKFIQIDKDIFGYGNLKISREYLNVTVAGSFNSDALNVLLVTPGAEMMHKLNISLEGKSLSGNYVNYTLSGTRSTGAISGSVIEESIFKKVKIGENWVECLAGLGLTPSKELAEKPAKGMDIINLAAELNNEPEDFEKTSTNSS